MQLNLSKVLEQFKRKWTEQLEPGAIIRVCREEGLIWRRRVLDPVRTIQLFFLQVLNGNSACTHLRHLSQLQFSAAAYCQARIRVPLAVFQTLLNRIGAGIEQQECDATWFGHRTLLIDGSSFSMPDTPSLNRYFGQPHGQRKGCGFPVAKILALFHAGTGMVLRVLSSPLNTHDMSRAAELHPELCPGDVLVGDRGFCSFGHICLLLQYRIHCVMRVHHCQIVNFRAGRSHTTSSHSKKREPRSKWLQKLGVKDQLVEWSKPKYRNSWISTEQFSVLPKSIVLRELCYRIKARGFRSREIILVTTLLSVEDYPAHAIADLYGTRWSIETNFAHLKTTMRMAVLRSTTVDGILKELCVFCLVYNLVRLVILEAAKRQAVPPERISFVDALRWLAATLQQHRNLEVLVVNPLRPNRAEPRAIKRRPKQYYLLRIPRQQLQALKKYQ